LFGLANRLHGATDGLHHIRHYEIGLLIAPLVFILGFMNAIVSVAAQTILQEHTTDSTRGKVFGALSMMVNIAATLPVFFAGVFADLFGVPAVITTLGLILLGFAAWQYYGLKRTQQLD
jgi:MFS family permease